MVLAMKCKTISKVATGPKAILKPAAAASAAEKAKQKKALKQAEAESEEDSEEEEVVEQTKIIKRPAAAGKNMEVEDSEEEDESEAEDEDESEEEAEVPSKMLKKPAAAAGGLKKKMEVDESEDEDEEEDEEDEVSDEEEDEEVDSKMMKKPAARAQKKVEESEDESVEAAEEDEESEEDASAQLVAVEEEKEQTEKEVVAERAKELKAMAASDLKELMENNGLEKGTKEAMIKTLLKHEGKVRAVAQEQKAKIRSIVIKKKQELENLSTPELGKLCNDTGLKGLKSKPERVQRLLVQWQENDGVDQALGKIAEEERRTELNAMDNTKLRKFCNKLGADPFVKEIMVERISKDENQKGFYARPTIKETELEAGKDKKVDMIDELLANEAERKKEKALRSQQEEVLAKKRKELKAMSVEELKKRVAKKGLESTGKRDDMVETLFIAGVQEDKAAARKGQLQSKSATELKELLSLNGLEAGSKEQMVKTMLAHEAKCHEELRAFEAKIDEAAAQKQKTLESKSNAQLKEMCIEKSLPAKGEKNERIENLILEAKKEREFDNMVCLSNRNKRKEQLMSTDKAAVLKLCETTGVDPFVKDIMIERIMSQESEAGATVVVGDEPAAKKPRVSKK